MKLIDLLVQELPQNGGWPLGVLCLSQSPIDGEIYKHKDTGGFTARRSLYLPKSEDPLCKVLRSEYEAAIAASQQPAWNGEGLPPVGTECEWKDTNTGKWQKVKVVYSSEWVTVIREDKEVDAVELAIESYGGDKSKEFRKIRTEAECKREETVNGIVDFYIGYHSYPKGAEEYLRVAKALHEAIESGKILGLKLEVSDE